MLKISIDAGVRNIQKLLGLNIRDKIMYRPWVYAMEEAVRNKYGDSIRKTCHADIFTMTGEARLAAEREIQADLMSCPALGLTNAVKRIDRDLRDWVRANGLGAVDEVKMASKKVIRVNLRTVLFPYLSATAPATGKRLFEENIAKLEEKGMTFSQGAGNDSKVILLNDRNVNILREMLGEIGASKISLETRCWKDRLFITDVSFSLPSDFRCSREAVQEKPQGTESLTDDEIILVKRAIKDLRPLQLDGDGDDIQDMIANVVLYAYADMCRIFNAKTTISENIEKAHEKERSRNLQATELSRQTGELMTAEMMENGYETLYGIIEKKCQSVFDLFMSDFYITPYSVCWKMVPNSCFSNVNEKNKLFAFQEDGYVCLRENTLPMLKQRLSEDFGADIVSVQIGRENSVRSIEVETSKISLLL